MWARQLGEPHGVNDPAAGGRALLPDHRGSSTGIDQSWPGARGPGQLRLLPRGGRRADGRPVRAGVRALEGRGHPRRRLVHELPPDWDRMGPYLEAAMSRVPVSIEVGIRTFFCGPGELHPRPAPGRRRGARGAQLLRRGRAQLDRHPHRRRPRPRWWRTGSSTAHPDVDVTGMQHRPAAAATRPTPSTAAPAPSSRSGRSTPATTRNKSMHTARGAKRSPLHEPPRGAARLLPRRQRLGGRRLVRARGRRARPRARSTWGRPAWFGRLGGRAPRLSARA